MLAKRIIPCLDVRNGRVVKGKKFENVEDIDDPVALGKRYSNEGADELVFYDITASVEDRKTSLEFVERVAREINIPFSVGGGISSIKDFENVLRKGADKVSVNSAALRNPKLIEEAALKYGSQCVVLSIDTKKVSDGKWQVYAMGGRTNTGIDLISWVKQGVYLGAGEIVLNSIDSDGMKDGYDIDLLKRVVDTVNIPVIASGGAGKMKDFYDAAKLADVDGILAASVFHYGEIKIKDLKIYLKELGISIRL